MLENEELYEAHDDNVIEEIIQIEDTTVLSYNSLLVCDSTIQIVIFHLNQSKSPPTYQLLQDENISCHHANTNFILVFMKTATSNQVRSFCLSIQWQYIIFNLPLSESIVY